MGRRRDPEMDLENFAQNRPRNKFGMFPCLSAAKLQRQAAKLASNAYHSGAWAKGRNRVAEVVDLHKGKKKELSDAESEGLGKPQITSDFRWSKNLRKPKIFAWPKNLRKLEILQTRDR